MKNKLKINIFFLIFYFLLFNTLSKSNEPFVFDVTELEIIEDGNIFLGQKKGTAKTDNGIVISADNFRYNKLKNILFANGNVKIIDIIKDITVYSEDIVYYKNDEIIVSNKKSRAENKEITINANIFEYKKLSNTIIAKGNVIIKDLVNDYYSKAEHITYYRNEERIETKGDSNSVIKSKYNFYSSDITILRNKKEMSSVHKSKLIDEDLTQYDFDNYIYLFDKEFLKANNVNIISNNSLSEGQTDQAYFLNGFFDLKNKNFDASETKVKIKKNSFDNSDNDPRIIGISSQSKNGVTKINKASFTSCKLDKDKCPPWSISANKITHDKNKKQLIYDHAILKVYDKPVMYFPKFFHPDPTVERQSGFLKPQLNNSEILGSSVFLPYFHVISESKDLTLKPTIFDTKIKMYQSEYRQENRDSSFIADINVVKGYKSKSLNKKSTLTHFFSRYEKNLNLKNYLKSFFSFVVEKSNNDTYLRVFDTNLIDIDKSIKPSNIGSLNTGIKLELDHKDYDFSGGMNVYENLSVGKSSDKYQYILPYYDFSKEIYSNNYGSINLNSSGSNNLSNTNNLRSRIINDFNLSSFDFFSEIGIKNNLNIYVKNLNVVAKNDTKYKSSPSTEVANIYNFTSSLPLIKESNDFNEYLEPKLSFRINPGDMIDNSANKRLINTDNVFDINRLGLSDTFETGKSLTIGIDYKKESNKENIIKKNIQTEDINDYFEIKLATVFKDKNEELIPESSTLDKKSSNLFGSIKNQHTAKSESALIDLFSLGYYFSLDNDLNTLNYNSLNSELNIGNFKSELNFIKEGGVIGSSSSIQNTFSYNHDDKNFFSFNTRRNRKINLTEYYDFVYEYKNDCLTAGIKYKKTYYQDRDIKPTEDLMLTFTFYPLTTYEQEIDQDLYRN